MTLTLLTKVTTIALALLACAPGVAFAIPQIKVDRGCYLDTVVNGKRIAPAVTLTGSDYTPGGRYQISLDGQPLSGGSGTFDTSGSLVGTFSTTALTTLDRLQKTWKVRVDEGSNTATTTFQTSDVYASFSPARGNPAKLKVSWVANGFKLALAKTAADPFVYLHYVTPGGKHKRTVRLGVATGPCGRLARTSRLRLFPFKARRGLWRLQVDTNRTYRRGTRRSTFAYYAIGVRISGA